MAGYFEGHKKSNPLFSEEPSRPNIQEPTAESTDTGNTSEGRTGKGKTDTGNTGKRKTGTESTDKGKNGQGNTGSGNSGSGNSSSGNSGSGNSGSGNSGSGKTSSVNPCSGETGNEDFDNDSSGVCFPDSGLPSGGIPGVGPGGTGPGNSNKKDKEKKDSEVELTVRIVFSSMSYSKFSSETGVKIVRSNKPGKSSKPILYPAQTWPDKTYSYEGRCDELIFIDCGSDKIKQYMKSGEGEKVLAKYMSFAIMTLKDILYRLTKAGKKGNVHCQIISMHPCQKCMFALSALLGKILSDGAMYNSFVFDVLSQPEYNSTFNWIETYEWSIDVVYNAAFNIHKASVENKKSAKSRTDEIHALLGCQEGMFGGRITKPWRNTWEDKGQWKKDNKGKWYRDLSTRRRWVDDDGQWWVRYEGVDYKYEELQEEWRKVAHPNDDELDERIKEAEDNYNDAQARTKATKAKVNAAENRRNDGITDEIINEEINNLRQNPEYANISDKDAMEMLAKKGLIPRSGDEIMEDDIIINPNGNTLSEIAQKTQKGTGLTSLEKLYYVNGQYVTGAQLDEIIKKAEKNEQIAKQQLDMAKAAKEMKDIQDYMFWLNAVSVLLIVPCAVCPAFAIADIVVNVYMFELQGDMNELTMGKGNRHSAIDWALFGFTIFCDVISLAPYLMKIKPVNTKVNNFFEKHPTQVNLQPEVKPKPKSKMTLKSTNEKGDVITTELVENGKGEYTITTKNEKGDIIKKENTYLEGDTVYKREVEFDYEGNKMTARKKNENGEVIIEEYVQNGKGDYSITTKNERGDIIKKENTYVEGDTLYRKESSTADFDGRDFTNRTRNENGDLIIEEYVEKDNGYYTITTKNESGDVIKVENAYRDGDTIKRGGSNGDFDYVKQEGNKMTYYSRNEKGEIITEEVVQNGKGDYTITTKNENGVVTKKESTYLEGDTIYKREEEFDIEGNKLTARKKNKNGEFFTEEYVQNEKGEYSVTTKNEKGEVIKEEYIRREGDKYIRSEKTLGSGEGSPNEKPLGDGDASPMEKLEMQSKDLDDIGASNENIANGLGNVDETISWASKDYTPLLEPISNISNWTNPNTAYKSTKLGKALTGFQILTGIPYYFNAFMAVKNLTTSSDPSKEAGDYLTKKGVTDVNLPDNYDEAYAKLVIEETEKRLTELEQNGIYDGEEFDALLDRNVAAKESLESQSANKKILKF